MNWEEAVDFYNIDLMYRDACFENARLLPQKIIEFGKRWVDSQKKTSLFLFLIKITLPPAPMPYPCIGKRILRRAAIMFFALKNAIPKKAFLAWATSLPTLTCAANV